MKNAGFLNLPVWKDRLQGILVKMGREDLLKLPLLGRENSDNAWPAFDRDEFFSLVETGILFKGRPVKDFPPRIITSDSSLALLRLEEGLYSSTFFSAAIGGTFPFINLLKDCCIERPVKFFSQNDAFAGFVLSTMEKSGKEIEEAFNDARWKGIADESSNLSLHGIVSRNRLVLQVAEIFGCYVNPEKIKTIGISSILKEDVSLAKGFGMSIRLLSIAEFDGKELKAITEPCMIPDRYFLAQARAGSEILYVITSDNQSQVYACPGSSAETEARGIVKDLESAGDASRKELVRIDKVGDFENKFYIRFDVTNLTSTLAELLRIFETADIEIDNIRHLSVSYETVEGVPLVLFTKETTRNSLNKAIELIKRNIKLASIKACFRIVDRG